MTFINFGAVGMMPGVFSCKSNRCAQIGVRFFMFLLMPVLLASSAFAQNQRSGNDIDSTRTFWLRSELVGKFFNGRIRSGDSATDAVAFMYEFEHAADRTRYWLAWGTRGAPPVTVRFPVRSTVLDIMTPPRKTGAVPKPARAKAGKDGWYRRTLTDVPVYVRECGPVQRPDLLVDSLWTRPRQLVVSVPCTVLVRIRNTGHASPAISPKRGDTAVVLSDNGEVVGIGRHLPALDSAASGIIRLPTLWTPRTAGDRLLRVMVNPRVFMETDFDNNARYRQYRVWTEK